MVAQLAGGPALDSIRPALVQGWVCGERYGQSRELGGVFLLFQYWTHSRTASSADMFIQHPIHVFSDPQEKPVYHVSRVAC